MAAAQAKLDFALEITAPEDARCTPGATLRSAIETRVGRLVFLDDPNPARRIDVSVAKDANAGWTADIVMRDDTKKVVGERRVTAEGSTCSELDDALILVISTLIGIADEAQAAQPKPEPEPEPSATQHESHAPAPIPPAPAAKRAPIAPAANSTPTAYFLSVAARGDIGFLPGFVPGVALSFDVDFGALALSLGGTFLPYAHDDLGRGAEARFLGATGEAALCFDAARPLGNTLAFCGGAEAGTIEVTTRGLYAHATRYEPVVRALLGPRLQVGLGHDFGLLGRLDAAIPVFFPRYYYYDSDGERAYYHSVGLGVSARLGIYWRFSS